MGIDREWWGGGAGTRDEMVKTAVPAEKPAGRVVCLAPKFLHADHLSAFTLNLWPIRGGSSKVGPWIPMSHKFGSLVNK
jgi:hypothetical protein